MISKLLTKVIFLCAPYLFAKGIDVEVAINCEFTMDACCMSVLAGVQLAVTDANAKNGTLIPDLASTTKDITLKIGAIFDPYDSPAWQSFANYFRSPGAPVALFGGYYTTNVVKFSQEISALKLPQLPYVSGPIFSSYPVFSNVFRIKPVDTVKAKTMHKVMNRFGIKNAAVFYTASDSWSEGLFESLRDECTISAGTCSLSPFSMENHPLATAVIAALQDAKSKGLRCMVSVLATSTDNVGLAAEAAKLDLGGLGAPGYMWFLSWTFWDTSRPDIWGGSMTLDFPNSGMIPSKIPSFKAQWAERVPMIRLPEGTGQHMTMQSSRDATGCMFLSGPAYDTLARVRVALERIDLTSLPSNPGSAAFSQDWVGSKLRDELQMGVSIDGLAAGPAMRKSAALGEEWLENPSELHVTNMLSSGEVITIYLATTTTLSEGPDWSRAVLSGDVPLNTEQATPAESGALPGHLQQTPCNGVNSGKCRLGACIETPRLGSAPGWCDCTLGYGGMFCNLMSVIYLSAPAARVPVNLSVRIDKFSGLSDTGDRFTCKLTLIVSWVDRRFPHDAGTYTDTEAVALLSPYWLPKVTTSNVNTGEDHVTVTVIRNLDESKSVVRDVHLTATHEFSVTNLIAPNFERFPFDSHDLQLKLGSGSPELVITYVPTTVVSQEALSTWEDSGWKPDWTDDADLVKVETPGTSFILTLSVKRHWFAMLFRLLIPSFILVHVSWSAFFISPSKLMPRFASGFISFLAIQSFKTYAASLMPNNGKISTTSWIDIYISMGGIVMGLSVIETVFVQFINENISHTACRNVDHLARWAFPLLFYSLILLMFVVSDTQLCNALVHCSLVVFIVVFFSYTAFQSFLFPVLVFRSSLRHVAPKQGSRVHHTWQFDDNEMKIIFDRVHKMSWRKERAGYVNTEIFGSWIQKWKPPLRQHSEEFRGILQRYFGERFNYPTFKDKFPKFLTQVEKLLIGLPIDPTDDEEASQAVDKRDSTTSRRNVAGINHEDSSCALRFTSFGTATREMQDDASDENV